MVQFIQPVQAFYDDDEALILALISYRSEKEFSDLFDLSAAVYGSYEHAEHGHVALVALSRSSYEQIHLAASSATIIDEQFNVSDYYLMQEDSGAVISLPGVSNILPLSQSVLLLKAEEQLSFSNAEPLRKKVMVPPYLAETIDVNTTVEEVPTASVENRIMVFVIVITLLAFLVSLAFYMIRRRKHDISKYY